MITADLKMFTAAKTSAKTNPDYPLGKVCHAGGRKLETK
jgi:hypothetical protein